MSIIHEENRLARDRAESWFKFENVGDQCEGTILDMFETDGSDGMPAQRVFTVETPEGKIVNLPLKKTRYVTDRTDDLQIGDEVGAKFEKEIEAKKKGYNPAKSIALFIKKNGPRTGANAGNLSPEKSDADKAFDAIPDGDDSDESQTDVPFD